MYSARFEIPKEEIATFLNSNSHLLSKCELYSTNYPEHVSVNFTSDDEFHVTTLDEIYYHISDDNRRREMITENRDLPF